MEENKDLQSTDPETQEEAQESSVDELIEKALEAAEDRSDEDDEVSEYNDTASQIADMEDALADSKEQYLRLMAEYDNFRKRTAREKTETYQNASVKCVESLLPVIDSFERSLAFECSDENFKNGMSMIFGQLQEFLTKMNVTEIEALGAEFDPNIHNAIQQAESEEYASGHVCQVFQKGYMLGDKLIRPAMVVVAL
ncbi:MAG: nucleotide exchange factor GrpE [Ruminococcus sp.]|nr:nucleotide exchange factor GrpE [Ruminococcus sp.]